MAPGQTNKRQSPAALAVCAFLAVGVFAAIALLAPLRAMAADDVELLMFDSPSCGYCLRWHREVGPHYSSSPEGQVAPLRVWQLHDGRPPGVRLSQGVSGTPTFVVLEGGVEVGRIVGYPGPDMFWTLLGRELDKLSTGPGGWRPAPQPGTMPEPLTRTSWQPGSWGAMSLR